MIVKSPKDVQSAEPAAPVGLGAWAARPPVADETGTVDIADIDAKLGTTKRTQRRVSDMSGRLLRDFECPRCRVDNDTRSLLIPVQGATADLLRCYFCGGDFPDSR
jgi:hypothetical protein